MGSGLEDIDASDIAIPRIRILHDRALFEDSLTKAVFAELDCIPLGVIKQRIMWEKVMQEDAQPLCKSPGQRDPMNANSQMLGFPNQGEKFAFPWNESNFNPAQFPPGEDGMIRLPCKSCTFSEWHNDPRDPKKRLAPPCNEQYNFPILYRIDPTDPYAPALFTVQKTGIKPAKDYISAFFQRKMPLFSATAKVTLKTATQYGRQYCIPQWQHTGKTEGRQWPEFAKTYEGVREFITAEPISREEDSTSAPQGYQPPPQQYAQPGNIVDAEVLPEAQVYQPPVQQQQPVYQQPVQQQPVYQQPVAPPAPPAVPQPMQQAAPAPQPVAPQPVQQAAPAAQPMADEEELPF
jgi:hypothetical protein